MSVILDEIISYKREFVKTLKIQGKRNKIIYHFKDRLKKNKINVIAEIKKASPSSGFIADIDLDKILPLYEKYASAISVLTDEKFFKGGFDVLRSVASRVNLPVLCKDFIIDKAQIDKAYECGADMVLLIVRILNKKKFTELYSYAKSLGMDVLVEIHAKNEVDFVVNYGCDMVGVNSRNLDTLEISLTRALEILNMLGDRFIRIAESGIKIKEDIDYLKNSCEAFLIGESLLKGEINLSEII